MTRRDLWERLRSSYRSEGPGVLLMTPGPDSNRDLDMGLCDLGINPDYDSVFGFGCFVSDNDADLDPDIGSDFIGDLDFGCYDCDEDSDHDSG